MTIYREPVRLTEGHDVSGFKCGNAVLDEWFEKFALNDQRSGMTRTYVITADDGEEVVGFYALSTGGTAHDEAPPRVKRGVARHPVPVIILTRLGVHEDHQGKRLGRGLLRDALIRVANAADEIGVRALLIHCKDDEARSFYLSQVKEFEPSPVDPLQLFLLMKDLRLALEQ